MSVCERFCFRLIYSCSPIICLQLPNQSINVEHYTYALKMHRLNRVKLHVTPLITCLLIIKNEFNYSTNVRHLKNMSLDGGKCL